MSALLKRTGKVTVAEWEAALAEEEVKFAQIVADLEKKREYINQPNLDPWFVQNAKPDIDRLEAHETLQASVIAEIKEKLLLARSARPSALRELKHAYEERDELANEISKRLPVILAELTSILTRVAKNDERLLKVAAAGEGDICSTSAWDKARGLESQLVVQGGSAAPYMVLHDLSGKQIWPADQGNQKPLKNLPAFIDVKNVGPNPLTVVRGAHYLAVAPGGSVESVPSNCGVVGNPHAVISVR
ncbi:MAG: hypothetical protein WBA85_05945 [Brucella anthropi]